MTAAPLTLHPFYDDALPAPGTKFVAFYGDGSGSALFVRFDDGDYADAEMEERAKFSADGFMDAGFLWWSRMPDDFEFFGENAE